MDIVIDRYTRQCNRGSDINQHLPTIRKYATECVSAMELGVRGVVSTWAILLGMLENRLAFVPRILIMNDIEKCNVQDVLKATTHLPITVRTHWGSDLEMPIDHDVDLLFIDTWHVYAQLKRELEKFAPHARKYIIMHDTETFGQKSEAVKKRNVDDMARRTGFPKNEIEMGLQPAVDEFLEAHGDEWEVAEVFKNNNGLTILRRIVPSL